MAGGDVGDDGSLAEDMMNVEALLGHNVVQMVTDNLILDLLRTYSSDRDRVQKVVSELQRTYLKDDLALYMDEDDDVLLALDNPYLSSPGTSNARIGSIPSSKDSVPMTSSGGVISSTSSCNNSGCGNNRKEPVLKPAKLNISAALQGNRHVREIPEQCNSSISSVSLNERIAGSFANHRKADQGRNTDSSCTSSEDDSEPEVVTIHEEDRKRKRICSNKSPGKKTRVEIVDLVESSPKSCLNYEDYLGIFEAMFPDADPVFLMQKFQHIENEEELNVVAATLLESNNYPRIGTGAVNVLGGERQSTMNINNSSVIIKPSAFEVPRTIQPQPSTSSNVCISNENTVMSEPQNRGEPGGSQPVLSLDDILSASGATEKITSLPQPGGAAPDMLNSSEAVKYPCPLVIDELADTSQPKASTSNQVNIQEPVSFATSGIPKQEILNSVPSHSAQTVSIPKTLQPSLIDIPTSSALSHETPELLPTSEPLPFPSSHVKNAILPPVLTVQNNGVVGSVDEPGPSHKNDEPWTDKYSTLLCLFPHSDPKYLERKAKLLHDKDIDFNLFVETTLENMPNLPQGNGRGDDLQELPVNPFEPVNVNHKESSVANVPLPSGSNRPEHRNADTSGPKAANIPQMSSTNTKGPTKEDVPGPSNSSSPRPIASNSSGPSSVNVSQPSAFSIPRPIASNTSGPSSVNVSQPSAFSIPRPIACNSSGPSSVNVLQPSAFSIPRPIASNSSGPSNVNAPRPIASNTSGPSSVNVSQSSAFSVPRPSPRDASEPNSVNAPRPSAISIPGPSSVNVPQLSATSVPGPSNAHVPGPSGINVAGPSGINERESEVGPWSEKYSFLLSILPDADPTFLEEKAKSLFNKEEDMKTFVANALENKDYPTLKDYQRRQEMIALQNKYLNDFNIENFLDIVPEPFKYFSQTNRTPSPDSRERGLLFLKRKYRLIRSNDITATYKKHQYNLTNTCHELDTFRGNPLKSRRPDFLISDKLPDTNLNLQFLQEVAFIENEKKIKKYLKDKEEEEERALKEARDKGELLECNCCFDDEVLARNIVTCSEGHIFCKNCVRKGAETKIGDGEMKFSCLTDCQAEFTLQSLQGVLKPTVFSKLAQRKQVEEIKAAGIEDLVQCPFCDFCNIPGTGDKIFRCLNPDCMKDSCIMCKEESHIPLRCDEVEKASEVKMRTYIEDKMTEALVRTCWKCQKKFVKIDGCNKMTCRCGALMCYICRQPVKDYSHFNGQGGDAYDKCPLFSDNNSLHVDAVERVAAEAKAELAQKHPGVTLKHDPTSVPIPREANGRRPVQPHPLAQIPRGGLEHHVPYRYPVVLAGNRQPPPFVAPHPAAPPAVARAFAPVLNYPHAAAGADNEGNYPYHLPPMPPLEPVNRAHRRGLHHERNRRRAVAIRRLLEYNRNAAEDFQRLAADFRRGGNEIVANRNQGHQLRGADAGLVYQAEMGRLPFLAVPPPVDIAAPNGNAYAQIHNRYPYHPNPN